MLSSIFSKKTASEIYSIAQTSEDATDCLVQVIRAKRLGMYSPAISAKIQGLMDFTSGLNSQLTSLETIDSPQKMISQILSYSWSDKEHFLVISLNVKNNVLAVECISTGTDTQCLASPKIIFGSAIKQGASNIIVAHNHPSGHLSPSSEDIALTKDLISAGKAIDIPILDHLILSWGKWVSLRETTSLW